MDRVRRLFRTKDDYEPLEGGSEGLDGEPIEHAKQKAFSWFDYSVFLLLGVATLWAWNMFLAAGPYFHRRFASSERILANFQSTELSVSTISNLGSMIVLAKRQANASYPKRIISSLTLTMATFLLLALSTKVFLGVSAGVYFGFLIVMVCLASIAAGTMQNGVYAYVAGFGREEYTQAIMTGQGIAGVLPCIVQIASVLSVPSKAEDNLPQQSSTSAFIYFLTATLISATTMVAFSLLLSRHKAGGKRGQTAAGLDGEDENLADREQGSIPLMRLFSKLYWLSGAVFLTYAVTMVFPVFTQQITSVQPTESAPRILHPQSFIPLAFLFWNIGDLAGRILSAVPKLSLSGSPRVLFLAAAARLIWIPLYLLCNIGGKGAVIPSDLFYLVIIQLPFGLSNGFIGTQCMVGFVEWVDVEERPAAGGFMGLCLVAGLSAGSLLSFIVAG